MLFSMLLLSATSVVVETPLTDSLSTVIARGLNFFQAVNGGIKGVKQDALPGNFSPMLCREGDSSRVECGGQCSFVLPRNPIGMEELMSIMFQQSISFHEQSLSFQRIIFDLEVKHQEELRAYREEQRKREEEQRKREEEQRKREEDLLRKAIQESLQFATVGQGLIVAQNPAVSNQLVVTSSVITPPNVQQDSKQLLEKIQDLHLTVRHLAFATEPLPVSHIIPGELPPGVLGETIKRCIQRLWAFGLTQKKLSKKNQNFKINDSVTGFGDCHIRSYRVIRYEQLYGRDLSKMPHYSANSIIMGWIQKRYFMKAADVHQCGGLHIPERQHVPSHFSYHEEFSKLFTVSNRDEADVLFNCLSFLLLVVDQIEALRHKEIDAEPLENIRFREDDKGLITVEPCSHYKTLDQIFKRSKQFGINWLILPSWIGADSMPCHSSPSYLDVSGDKAGADSKLMCVKVLMCNLTKDLYQENTNKVFTSLELFTRFMLSMGKNIDQSQGIKIAEETNNLAELFCIPGVSFLGKKVYQPSIQAVLQGKNKEPSINAFHIFSATESAAWDIQKDQQQFVEDKLNGKVKR